MDRRAWRAAVHSCKESDTTERRSICARVVFRDVILFLVKWLNISQGEATSYIQTLFFKKLTSGKISKPPQNPTKPFHLCFYWASSISFIK